MEGGERTMNKQLPSKVTDQGPSNVTYVREGRVSHFSDFLLEWEKFIFLVSGSIT